MRPQRLYGTRCRALVSLAVVFLLALGLLTASWLAGSPARVFAADKWTDITDAAWVQTYGITADQAAQVAAGFADGSFRPTQPVTRGQFAKMVVAGLGLATANPATPSYGDVARGSTFYVYVEGAKVAGLISGFSDGTFRPSAPISRQQSNSLLGIYLSGAEISGKGAITGLRASYPTLASWFAIEAEESLDPFSDVGSLLAVHRPPTAYLVYRGVVSGASAGLLRYLQPTNSVTRAQAVAMVVRTAKAAHLFAGPAVTALSPTSGPTTGGTTVVVMGTGFTEVTAVTFGSTVATSFTVNSAAQITAIAPAHAAGMVDVRVTAGGAQSATTAADNYTYVSASSPTVTAVNPTSGSTAGGNSLVISGTSFTGATSVTIGSTTLTGGFTVDSAAQITVTSVPAHAAGTVDVTVTTANGTSATNSADQYAFVSPNVPTVTAVSPATGPTAGGTTIMIAGTNLMGATAVKFGSVSADSFMVNSAAQIVAVSPPGTAGAVDVTVTTPDGTSVTGTPDRFTYVSPGTPTITAINPSSGPAAGGNHVVIAGTNLTGATAVTLGGITITSGFSIDSATQITVPSVPAHAVGVVDVTVTTPGGTSPTGVAAQYTYLARPTVTNLSPTSGPTAGGTTVIVTGTDLTGATAVTFGSVNATSFTLDSPTQITATSPSGSAGMVDVTVTGPGGTSALGAGDQFTYGLPVPTVTGVSPSSGPTTGGAYGGTTVTAFKVVIAGTNFTGATAVKFGGTSAVSFIVNSDSQITAVAPAGSAGVVDISVTTPAGTSAASSADNYTYYFFMVAKGATVKTYGLADLESMTAVSGYGGFLNTFPRFVDQGELTGVSVLDLLGEVGGLAAGHSVAVTASDGYVRTFTYDQVANNNFTMYDPSSDAHNPTIITSLTDPPLQFIVAYEQNGSPIGDAAGPLRTAFVNPVGEEQATDSVNWVKYIVKIEAL